MSDAADHASDLEDQFHQTEAIMIAAGCKRCNRLHDENECPICHDLGWLDTNGEPCEP